ncbi:hypothetical protein DEAC_c43830 [Desulfosporosinus acididurans]|uniref:Uncharacterized protein n=1 Tax=Desulfosporosinus acididurans TaxID=476652 RepID=A0A0J1FJU1_9FIRM|nr:hypothetical protein [Desulfosporosinus acididurans]KLU63697.1 hypothetical protein DEAC_c43830 [Desulfosporosinus acididurans]
MNRFQLEKLYEVNGLKDYKLKTPEDLLKTHGIDFREVDGYNRLDDLNKQLYSKFIVNFFNGLGLDSRMTLIPKGIYYAEDFDYLVKENPEDDYYNVAGGVVLAIDRNGVKTVHRTWKDEDHTHLEAIESKHKTYLRFEYEHDGRPEWLHVTDQKNWY